MSSSQSLEKLHVLANTFVFRAIWGEASAVLTGIVKHFLCPFFNFSLLLVVPLLCCSHCIASFKFFYFTAMPMSASIGCIFFNITMTQLDIEWVWYPVLCLQLHVGQCQVTQVLRFLSSVTKGLVTHPDLREDGLWHFRCLKFCSVNKALNSETDMYDLLWSLVWVDVFFWLWEIEVCV